MSKLVKLIECPRDAMQGIRHFIHTDQKLRYIQSLLTVGFDTIDLGSFVSPKAIPQMADTAKLLERLDTSRTSSKLLVIVANRRGAVQACKFLDVDYLGYPFSISENFQMRNTHKTISQSIEVLNDIMALADKNRKRVVVYLSMGFGNPYGDPWNVEIVAQWVEKLTQLGVHVLSLSDTVGSALPETIEQLFRQLIPAYPHVEFGAHLHTLPHQWYEKLDAAYSGGCRRFDGAIRGYGGCPMAKDELVGNMPTEKMLSYFTTKKAHQLNTIDFETAYNETLKVFGEGRNRP